MPLIDKVEKSWTVYKGNRPKTIQHNAPRWPQGHAPKASRRLRHPSNHSRHKHGGGKPQRKEIPGAAAPTSTPAPRPRPRTSRRPCHPSNHSRRKNTAEATLNARRNPEPPLRHPRRPQGRAPPSRGRRNRRRQPPALHIPLGPVEHPRRGPKRQATQERRPRPIPRGI